MEDTEAECYRLGYGSPVAVSASTGEGMADLYVALQPHVDAIREQLIQEHGLQDTQPISALETQRRNFEEAGNALELGLAESSIGRSAEELISSKQAQQSFRRSQQQIASEGTVDGHTRQQLISDKEQSIDAVTTAHETSSPLPIRLSILGLPNVVRTPPWLESSFRSLRYSHSFPAAASFLAVCSGKACRLLNDHDNFFSRQPDGSIIESAHLDCHIVHPLLPLQEMGCGMFHDVTYV